jgi:hypothetical protein
MGGRRRKALMKIRIGPLEGQPPLLTLLTNLGKLPLQLIYKILDYLPIGLILQISRQKTNFLAAASLLIPFTDPFSTTATSSSLL